MTALRSISEGGASLTPVVARHLLEWVREHDEVDRARSHSAPKRLDLTEREQDVLRSMVAGRTYAETGEELGISYETVRTHVRNIYRKLQVRNQAEAVSKAVRSRLV
jgi:DNA-binding CsgD family transcriptional regulator